MANTIIAIVYIDVIFTCIHMFVLYFKDTLLYPNAFELKFKRQIDYFNFAAFNRKI